MMIDQQVIQNFVGFCVDDSYMVSWVKGDKGIFVIVGEFNIDWLNFVLVYVRYFEMNGMVNLVCSCVYNCYCFVNFSRCLNQVVIFVEFNMMWLLVYQCIVYQFMCVGVDLVQYISGFRGINDLFVIWVYCYVFWFYFYINLCNDGLGFGIDYCYYCVVFIGDV